MNSKEEVDGCVASKNTTMEDEVSGSQTATQPLYASDESALDEDHSISSEGETSNAVRKEKILSNCIASIYTVLIFLVGIFVSFEAYPKSLRAGQQNSQNRPILKQRHCAQHRKPPKESL